jgi:hypothetical protein
LDDNGKVTDIGITDHNISSSHLVTLYPNPASDHISIVYQLENQSATYRMIIDDDKGCMLKNIPLHEQKNIITFDLQGFAPGNYVCSLLENNKKVSSKKFIVKN